MTEQVNGVEAEAAQIGWAPKEQWRGDPERWVDAETFLERGRQIMPILKKTNENLTTRLSAQQAEIERLKELDRVRGETIRNLTEFQAAEVKRQVAEQLADLKAQKRAAIKEGDHELAADLDEKLDEVRERAATVTSTTPTTPTPSAPPIEPWAQEFATANADWFQKDKRKTALFAGIADDLFTTGLRGKALLDAAKKEMEAVFAPPPSPSKVEGGGGGASSSGGGRSGKSFSDLPADAREVCKSQARQFVGEKKAFKTEAEWQKHYASVYFASNE